jgi:hypothetical protein
MVFPFSCEKQNGQLLNCVDYTSAAQFNLANDRGTVLADHDDVSSDITAYQAQRLMVRRWPSKTLSRTSSLAFVVDSHA